jgi:hypothetical protein
MAALSEIGTVKMQLDRSIDIEDFKELEDNTSMTFHLAKMRRILTCLATATKPSKDGQVPTIFTLFPQLPLELQREIWKLAAEAWQDRVLPFSVTYTSGPTFGGTENSLHTHPWKHISSSIQVHALLLVCHESAAVTRAFHATLERGLDVSFGGKEWNPVIAGFGLEARVEDCQYEIEVQKNNRTRYWDPESDVVLIKHANDTYGCSMKSFCNTEDAIYSFKFDKKLKYMAFTREAWDFGFNIDNIPKIECPGLEVAFVLADASALALRYGHHWQKNRFLKAQVEEHLLDEGEEMTRELHAPATGFLAFHRMFFHIEHEIEVKVIVSMEDSLRYIEERKLERRLLLARLATIASSVTN